MDWLERNKERTLEEMEANLEGYIPSVADHEGGLLSPAEVQGPLSNLEGIVTELKTRREKSRELTPQKSTKPPQQEQAEGQKAHSVREKLGTVVDRVAKESPAKGKQEKEPRRAERSVSGEESGPASLFHILQQSLVSMPTQSGTSLPGLPNPIGGGLSSPSDPTLPHYQFGQPPVTSHLGAAQASQAKVRMIPQDPRTVRSPLEELADTVLGQPYMSYGLARDSPGSFKRVGVSSNQASSTDGDSPSRGSRVVDSVPSSKPFPVERRVLPTCKKLMDS